MIKIEEILGFLKCNGIDYEYSGDLDLTINDYSMPNNIKDSSIIWLKDVNALESLDLSLYEQILIVTSDARKYTEKKVNFLISNNSKELFFSIMNNFFAKTKEKGYISKKSIIETEIIGKDIYIGHNCYIGPTVSIGDNVVIGHNVVIEGRVIIGNNTTIYSGAIIGSDGYGFYKNKEGENIHVPHLGGIIIGRDVEIGANTCIDRGTLGDTFIGDNVKIDNLVQIAHNVEIGENTMVLGQAAVSGSCSIGKNSYIAPKVTVKNQIRIGDNSMVGMGIVVTKNLSDNTVLAGNPPKEHNVNYNEILSL